MRVGDIGLRFSNRFHYEYIDKPNLERVFDNVQRASGQPVCLRSIHFCLVICTNLQDTAACNGM